jgi:sugar phosphate isomerase/epimerase
VRIATKRAQYELTYCTNIHPAHGWNEVLSSLRRYAPALRKRLAGDRLFGVGLRISADEATELLETGRLQEFRSFLADQGLYVALINGFPYGSFHGDRIKEQVFAPDWRDRRRVEYTLNLARILKQLLPEDLDGGISTCPLSFKAWIKTDADWQTITDNVATVAMELAKVRRETGRIIHLDIEPEPDGLVETANELIAFFKKHLLVQGVERWTSVEGISPEQARTQLLDHVQACFDTCHSAVEFETPGDALRAITDAGIKIGRIQLSSALESESHRPELEQFADSTYLHQVIAKGSGNELRHLGDLSEALSGDREPSAEWRIHFHVPIFASYYSGMHSTQKHLQEVLEYIASEQVTTHLEIETYTWDVLPPELKLDLLDSIEREYRWVIDHLDAQSR